MSHLELKGDFDQEIKEHDDIELAQPQQSFIYWVDSDLSPMWTIFFLFIAFLCIEIWMTLSAPRSFIAKHERVEIKQTQPTDPYTLDVSLEISKIQPSNRFIEINASAVRTDASKESTVTLNIESRYIFEYAGKTGSRETDSFVRTTTWKQGSKVSTPFQFFSKQLQDDTKFDKIIVEAQIATPIPEQITQIMGFDFTWFFGNSASMKYKQYSGIFLSISLLIIYIGYVYSVRLEKNITIEVLCLIFGIAGILAMNPIAFIVKDLVTETISSAVLISVFVALFRLFIVVDFYSTVINSVVSTGFLVVATIFYGVGAAISSVASYDRTLYLCEGHGLGFELFHSESLQMGFDIINLIIVVSLCIYGLVKTSFQSRQVIMLVVISAITQLTTLATHILFLITQSDYMNTVVPELIFHIVHVTCAGIVLHFMQPYEGIEYDPVGELKGAENIEVDFQEQPETVDVPEETDKPAAP